MYGQEQSVLLIVSYLQIDPQIQHNLYWNSRKLLVEIDRLLPKFLCEYQNL